VVRVVIAFMQAHPESLDQRLEILTWRALKEAWPCEN
jgi:hypothetical protein